MGSGGAGGDWVCNEVGDEQRGGKAQVPQDKEVALNYGPDHPVKNGKGAGRRGKGGQKDGGGEVEMQPKAKAKRSSAPFCCIRPRAETDFQMKL